MDNIKRKFLDFLYENRYCLKKIFHFKKNGYIVKLSAGELLKEINNKTEIGLNILEDLNETLDYQNTTFNLLKDLNNNSNNSDMGK